MKQLLSKTISLNLAYKFGYKYAKSRRISIDYIDNPSRDLDSVNSFNYTINSYRNTIESYFELVKNKFRLKFGPGIQIYDIASDEQLPSNIHSSHQYYSFTPSLDMSYMNAKHNLSLMVMSNADELSLEEIRNGLDATNPLVLFAGNPNLRQTKIYTASFKYEYTDVAHSSTYSVNASSNFAVDYATTKSTLFMEQTHLPMYDYTAQRGAQLNEIVNAEGCYGWNIGMWYSKKLAIDWTLKTGINYSFNRVPYFVSDEISYSKNQGGSLAVSAISGFSTKVNIELNSISELSDYNTMNKRSKQFTQSIRADIRSIILKHNTLTMSTAYYLYKNYSTPDVDSNDILTNVSIGRKFGKERKLELSIGVVDLFNRVNNVRTIFTNNYVTTTTNAYLGRYGYIRAMYRMGK